jgi:hypothetical protein
MRKISWIVVTKMMMEQRGKFPLDDEEDRANVVISELVDRNLHSEGVLIPDLGIYRQDNIESF